MQTIINAKVYLKIDHKFMTYSFKATKMNPSINIKHDKKYYY